MKYSNSLPIMATLIFTLASNTANANAPWFLRLAFESGGDELVNVVFDDGETDKIRAGGQSHLEVGKQFSPIANNPSLLLEITAGYKFDRVKATNGDLKFSRITIGAMQFYKFNKKFRLGAGLTYHMNPTLSVDAFGINEDFENDDSMGFVLGADYAFSKRARVGVRATQIDYEGDNLIKTSGDSFGGFVNFYF